MSIEEERGTEEVKLDVNKDLLVKYRVHLGRNVKTPFSEGFIYAHHQKGFYLIDLSKTLEKLKAAAKLLAQYNPEEVLVYSAREYASKGIETLSKLTGFRGLSGRLYPGTLTNYLLSHHIDASLLFVIDHTYDLQAVDEAIKVKIPIISLVDTNSDGSFVDLAIPANNKGRLAIAAILWSLAVLYLRERGILKENEVIDLKIEDFAAEA
ncbi:MAG: 30S ribosomal protein S2 [Candidatus Geothermarchaeota archaeon]